MEVYVKMCRYENFLLEITMQEKILEVLYNYSFQLIFIVSVH